MMSYTKRESILYHISSLFFLKNWQVISILAIVFGLHTACSSDSKQPEQTNEQVKTTIKVDSTAVANKAKRAQDIVNQAAQLASVYCNCTRRTAEVSRKECKGQVLDAVTQITATLKGAEKDAFETTYSEGAKACK